MNQYLKFISFGVLSFGILLLACQSSSNLPNSYDQRAAENHTTGQIKTILLDPAKTAFFGSEVITGASSYIFLGNYEGITAWALFRYAFNGVPDSSKIKSVQFTLYSSGAAGDTLAQFDATLHLMGSLNPEWDELDMNWTTFAQDFQATPLSAPAQVTGLSGDSVRFDLDLQQFTTADSLLDSVIIKNGFCLRFEPSQTIQMLKRFYSSDISTTALKPSLRIISEKAGVSDTTFDYAARETFIVQPGELAADNNQFLFTGRGYSWRSMLNFDISGIPANATINRARLIMVLARANSVFGLNSDINVRLQTITNWPENHADVSIDSTSTGVTSTSTEDTVSVELRAYLQDWSAGLSENHGVFLRALNEGDDICRLAFYGATADTLLRPKLIIEYTIPPETKY